jgi:hypothetical protein
MIYFTQTDIEHWDARTSRGVLVARIAEVADGALYQITYMRRPDRPLTHPRSTTRLVRGDLDHAQKLVLQRGWA